MHLAGESLAGRVAILHLSTLSQHEIYRQGQEENIEPFRVDQADIAARTGKQTDLEGIYTRIWQGSMPALLSKRYKTARPTTSPILKPI